MSTLPLIPLALAAGLLVSVPSEKGERHQVRVARVDGEFRCSVYAERAPLHELLTDLSRECEVVLEGFERVSRSAQVDVDLVDRPIAQVLDYVLGSVGLRVESRAGTWRVTDSPRAPLEPERLREEAMSALFAALRDFPDHPAAADGLIAQGLLELDRGHAAAASAQFDALVERFPDSPRVPEALWRSARAQMELHEWEDAADRFAELLRLDVEHPFESEARVELARCAIGRGEPADALVLLDALEALDPATDQTDERARGLVRAEALNDLGRARECMPLLDRIEALAPRGAEVVAVYEQRARALEAVGRPADAARLWLAFAESCPADERTLGLRHAARLALESGEELSVLFIARMAEDGRGADELAELAREARERLALSVSPREASLDQRLTRGEELVTTGKFGEARDALAVLGLSRGQLDQEQLARFALAYTRALAETDGVDEALSALRQLLPELSDSEARRALYLFAGDALEAVGRTDEAILAWQGRL